MNKVVEQTCIVRAVKNNGSNFILSLEPKKQACKGCDGKCAKMLKPTELIDIEYNHDDIKVGDLVLLYMDKKYLAKLVCYVLGVPLAILLLIVSLGYAFNIPELMLIMLIFVSLFISFVLQVRFLKLSKQIMVSKLT